MWRRILSHTIHQPNIPDLGESCTNIRYLPNLSQRGAVPSWTHRELLENFGRVSFSTLLCTLLSCSPLYLQGLLQKMLLSCSPQS